VRHRGGAGKLAAYRQALQLVANWRRSSIANTCGRRCISSAVCHVIINEYLFIIILIITTSYGK